MKNINKDSDTIVFDRDTSEPKNKMRIKSALRKEDNNKNNNISNNNNKNNEEEEEEIEEEVEEEIEEEIEDEKKEKKENEKKNELKEEDKKSEENIKNESNNIELKKEEKKESEPKIVIEIKKKETINPNSNQISNSNLKNSSCQVNLMSDEQTTKLIQTLKIKINNLIKEKQTLTSQTESIKKSYEEQLSQKQQEISSLSQINIKLKKNLEKVSTQVNKLLEKVEKKNMIKSCSTTNIDDNNLNIKYQSNKRLISSAANKLKLKDKNIKIKNNEENKEKNNEVELLKEKLNMKESQLKNSLNLIEFLSKDNKKLKLQYESIGKGNMETKNLNNYKLIEEIKKKNKELIQLEKEYKEFASLKTTDKQIEYYQNQFIKLKETNSQNEAKIKKLISIIEQYQKKETEAKNKLKYPNSPIVNNKYKINNETRSEKFDKNSQNRDKRSLSLVKPDDWRNHDLNNNFSKLFTEKEKKALTVLFENDEDYKNFNQKLVIIERHYNAEVRKREANINELKKYITDKDEQIAYLREKIRENEMKIKILLNQVHLERQKNDKKIPNQQGNNSNKSITKNS